MFKIPKNKSINDLLELFSEDANLVNFTINYNKESKKSLRLQLKDNSEPFTIISEVYSTEKLLQSLEKNYYYRNINSISGAIEINDFFFFTTKEKFIGVNLVESLLRYSCLKKYLSKIYLSKDNFEIFINNPRDIIQDIETNFFYPKFFYFDDEGRFLVDGENDHVYKCKDLSLEIEFFPRIEGEEFFLSDYDLFAFNTKYYK